MVKLHFYLIGGHGMDYSKDPGATGNGYKEYDLARKFNDKLAKYLKQRGAKVTVYNKKRDMYQRSARGKGLNVFKVNKRIVIETHLNAVSNKKAEGSEVLITNKYPADKYDKALERVMGKHFKNRGIKKRNDLLNMNIAAKRGINYRLIELCFISNKEDVTYLVKNMDKIAKDMAIELTK